MEALRKRIRNVLNELFEKHFECPERNWPRETHDAIVAIKNEIVASVEAEFEREWGVASKQPAAAQGAEAKK